MKWQPSNRLTLVPRELIFGTINGVDFGPRVSVIARAEKPMLLWLGGHSWSVNGWQKYSESHLTLIRDRTRMDGWRNYKSVGKPGGRLTVARLETCKAEICELFDCWDAICWTVRTGQTLLVEGGGQEPQPALSLGRTAYLAWRERNALSRH